MFNIGDVVEVSGSDDEYYYTRDGSVGVVVGPSPSSGGLLVQFTHFTCEEDAKESYLYEMSFSIDANYLIHATHDGVKKEVVSPIVRKIRQMESKWKNREAYV